VINNPLSRRSFLAGSAAAFQIIKPELVRGAGNAKLRSGLVGTGGRGTAAIQNVLTGCDNIEIVALADEAPVSAEAVTYANRLSDLLFVAARWANDRGRGDLLWKPGANR